MYDALVVRYFSFIIYIFLSFCPLCVGRNMATV